MRLSRYFLPLLKETPKEAEIVSHQLMLRAGMIKQQAAGSYSWLPLGFKVLNKIIRIIEEEQDKLGSRAENYFERMMNAAHRMQILIDDLLAYSRSNIEARNFERVHLSELLAEISEEVSEDLAVYEAMIETDKLGYVTIIPFQFRQLLHNLISNALKFSRPEKRPHIYITSKSDTGANFKIEQLDPVKRYTHIRFADNGIGFPPEFASKIFEVFQRLHTREKYSGTGIGLAIVRKIVENHEGFVSATGEPNKGATFDIYIPDRKI